MTRLKYIAAATVAAVFVTIHCYAQQQPQWQPPGDATPLGHLPVLIKEDSSALYIQHRKGKRSGLYGNISKPAIEYNFYPDGKGNYFFKLHTVHIAIPLIVGGTLLMNNDIGFRDLRNDFLGEWRYHYDDFFQYSPAAIMLGLKAFGVEGRSSWGRLMTSAAFSTVATVTMVNGLKLIGIRRRPDGSNMRSFPSGHTATAFATATMLHKEYGTTVSPWFSVLGYSIASGIGISRMLNNKHWLSDVVAGAGFGILATELGYYITDLIFKDRHLKSPTSEFSPIPNIGRPSFVSIMGGPNFGPGMKNTGKPGVKFGIQGAYFFTPWLGAGGRFEADRYANYLASNAYDMFGGSDPYPSDVPGFNTISVQAGMYGALPLGRKWIGMCYGLAGVGIPKASDFKGSFTREKPFGGYETTNVEVSYNNKPYFNFTLGVSATWIISNHHIRFFAETRSLKYNGTVQSDFIPTSPPRNEKSFHFPVSIGIAIDAMLW